MNSVVVISVAAGLILLLLLFGTSIKPVRFVGKLVVKILIGGILLFFLNTLGTSFDIHVPINAITTVVAGILGIPGIAALVVIKMFIV